MQNHSQATLLRIFISSTDKIKDEILYESIVLQAKAFGLAGATVTKGVLGYGASSVIHSYKFWELSDKLPIIIEITDESEKINSFYETIRPHLEEMRNGCLVTLSTAEVLLYKSGKKKQY
jgi:uncharacterized protein